MLTLKGNDVALRHEAIEVARLGETVILETKFSKSQFRRIQAWQTRNYHGDPSNLKKGTRDGDRWCVEEQVFQAGEIRFINHW